MVLTMDNKTKEQIALSIMTYHFVATSRYDHTWDDKNVRVAVTEYENFKNKGYDPIASALLACSSVCLGEQTNRGPDFLKGLEAIITEK